MEETKQPASLDEAIEQMILVTDTKAFDAVLNMTEREFRGSLHHTGGMSMRNDWNLWGVRKDKPTTLYEWFREKGIGHGDDISGIIFTSYYRTLRREPVDLEGQIKYYRDYWERQGVDPDQFCKPK